MSALAQMRSKDDDARLLAAALDACAENLAIVDSGRLLYSNPAFRKSFGYSQNSELCGAPLTQLFPEHRVAGGYSDGNSEKQIASPVSDADIAAIRKDGTQLRVQLSCVPFKVDTGELLILSLRERDAGNIADSPDKHSQPMEALGRVAGAVAHDFNNLLTGILLYCDLLIAGMDSNNPLRAYVTEIRRAGGHSAELIQQLMAVARPDSSATGAHSWNQVISAMSNLLHRLLGEKIELEMDLGSEDALVRMNAAQMRQIVLNLLLNARDAMPGGGRIKVTVRDCRGCLPQVRPNPPSACIVLAIEDGGFGMDAETRSHLFETFFTTKKPGHGNGLGLATINRIVQAQGGNIRVESEQGWGTRMSVHLPRAHRVTDAISITQKRNGDSSL